MLLSTLPIDTSLGRERHNAVQVSGREPENRALAHGKSGCGMRVWV